MLFSSKLLFMEQKLSKIIRKAHQAKASFQKIYSQNFYFIIL